ncbi:UDP-N-acetylglucosamine transferase subunit Alg13p [[Candida] railenensis]|uniref:UDP-N-acetylglucosamine transferase subunit ALG13 n=1 Tax=[Candida] railenensis TaxID=45579 RepID=A0A9P0QPW5_9ASCO|nr:UDP-N-acetylglucosamine transferase subunit Alg13p [[Candida] railenensis]
MSVLILTGATVTFRSLIDQVTSKEFITDISKAGISKLFIQYGNESANKSQIYFESSIKKSGLLYENTDGIYNSKSGSLQILAFPFSSDISGEYIEQVDIVVSHAGTGSIIDVLKLDKPLIVVVNESLMDNHQVDVANEFKKLNYCTISTCSGLSNEVARIFKEEAKFDKFESCSSSVMQSVIYNEVKLAH